ncbi:uncharacterized protein BBOV_IV008626 [Babesia bovis T2Bo]|uniref:Uncharacterized protein n=1 Tax=Babesia bovis TaxID=5865 RepID=S6BKC4_BABBO|nr:uncharacterized protein BBOV_IV008626 [Babesia bovis T2Bo]KAG6439931.1 hypothetical protein BBOV_IV008626 [Babesia bovis T2Bo]BAN64297.1 conserved hypothetical protein [Babesia bovis]
MHSYLIYVILSLPFVKAATHLPPEPSFAKVENESDVIAILKEIQNTAKTGNKGGAEIAASIIASKVNKNQDLFSIAHSYIKRGAFTGILPRCICKLVSCSLPICYSRCTSAEEENKELFDCTSCVGDCIPIFMRCLVGIDG